MFGLSTLISYCFCTERLIFIFTGAVICVLRIGDIFPYWSLYFVLKLTFLFWDTYCCTGVYFIVLVNILAQPMNMFVY